MDQAVWGTLQGDFLHQSNTPTGEYRCRMYLHFDPILLIFLPFYLIFASPKWMLLIQSLAIGISAVPIFWIARKRLPELWSLLISGCYLLYPVLQNANLYDFHQVTLAVPLVAFIFWALDEDKTRTFWALAGILLFVKEEMGLVLAAFGLYIMLNKKIKQGLFAFIVGMIGFYLVVNFVIPHFAGQAEHTMIGGAPGSIWEEGSRYGWLGGSVEEIITTLVTRPFYVLEELLVFPRIYYLLSLLLPLLFLPLFSSAVVVALPTLGINMLSRNDMMYNLYYYHSVLIAPVFFVSAIYVIDKVLRSGFKYRHYVLIEIVVLAVVFHLVQGLLPYTFAPLRYTWADLVPREKYEVADDMQKLIPDSASVCAQQNLGVFFSQRKDLYRFPLKAGECDYVAVDLENPYYGVMREELFDYMLKIPRPEIVKIMRDLIKNQGYGVIYAKHGGILLKKGFSNHRSMDILKKNVRRLGIIP